MQDETSSPGSQYRERRVHRHRLNWVFVLVGSLCALSAAYGLAYGFANGNASNMLLGLLVLPSAVPYLLLARVLRVETSPEGLAYYNMGIYTVRAGWEDVERVARVPFRGMGEVECIILRRSSVDGWTGLAWALPEERRPLTIPLGKWRSFWAGGDELRREVLSRAPHAAR